MMLLAENANETARGLIGRDYLSYSAVSTYQSCPLQFYFKYVAGLPEQVAPAALVFGGAIHACAEYHYNELLAGNKPPSLESLLGVYEKAWRDRNLGEVKFGKNDSFESLAQLAQRMLRAFQCSSAAQPAGRILGVEEELRGTLVQDCPDLFAKVDLLVEEPAALVITDLKTSRTTWSAEQASEKGEQLLMYAEIAKQILPEKSLRLRFVVATKTKNPLIESHEVEFNLHQVARTKEVFRRVWRAIEAGVFYPAPSAQNCAACPFRSPCRVWRG